VTTKSISSTLVQNNFGRILGDVVENHTRYVVTRHNVGQVIIIGLSDFEAIIEDKSEREHIVRMVRELRAKYRLGEPIGQG
jgi:prevent-host-death family protein